MLSKEARRGRLTRAQIRNATFILRAIALGRLPGEQSLNRRAAFNRFLVAFVMSAALWFYVTEQQNPVIRSQPYTLQVVFEHVPKGLAIRNLGTAVTVFARGLQDTVTSTQQIIPVVDLANVSPRAREATVPITITGGRSGVDYTSVPDSMTIRLEPLVSKTVPIIFNGQPILPINLSLQGQDISPKVLTVSGPANEVDRVASATVSPPTTSITPPDPTTTSFPYPFTSVPVLLDKFGHALPTNSLLPAGARITVTMQVQVTLLIKTLTVIPIVPFGPAFGYQLDAPPQPNPQTVTVFGSPDIIGTLKGVVTLPLSLQGVTKSMTVTTHLDLQGLPPGVTLYNPSKGASSSRSQGAPAWKVFVSVSKSQTNTVLPAAVQYDNLGKGLQANSDIHWVRVFVTGAYLDINALGPLVAHVDTSGLVQGTYNLTPTVRLPKTLSDAALTPSVVHVVIGPVRR